MISLQVERLKKNNVTAQTYTAYIFVISSIIISTDSVQCRPTV